MNSKTRKCVLGTDPAYWSRLPPLRRIVHTRTGKTYRTHGISPAASADARLCIKLAVFWPASRAPSDRLPGMRDDVTVSKELDADSALYIS